MWIQIYIGLTCIQAHTYLHAYIQKYTHKGQHIIVKYFLLVNLHTYSYTHSHMLRCWTYHDGKKYANQSHAHNGCPIGNANYGRQCDAGCVNGNA